MKIKIVKIIPFLLILFVLVNIHVQSAHAFLLDNTDCDPTDPTYPYLGYCHDACVGEVGSIPTVDNWCTNSVSGECTYEESPNGRTNICNCFCTFPAKNIECRQSGDCPPDESCVVGECQSSGGSTCDPMLSGLDCWSPMGPCDPDDPANNITYCIDEDMDGSGICLCNSRQFFGEITPLEIFCDQQGNPTKDAQWGKMWTAIGCIPIVDSQGDPVLTEFSKFWLRMGLSMGGGLALILIAISGILMKLSAGNPERAKLAKAIFAAALAGLFVLIFSAFILRLSGVQILGIPGLGI
ncbi:hypothetical protein IPM62_00485 [Candidatus Woesebacteria bacterium]|nr:MAG: hypothetical protein IPM62_00485 [Candidatus Woesebacteria bacterium]